MYGHEFYAMIYDSTAKSVRAINIYGFGDHAVRLTDNSLDLVQLERRVNTHFDFVLLTSEGRIQIHHGFHAGQNLYPNQPILCAYISLLPTIHEYLCIKKDDNSLHKINADTGNIMILPYIRKLKSIRLK